MDDALTRFLFITHLGSSWYMVGIIWFVQVVHYPLFSGIDQATFSTYERRHTNLTTWVVGPAMLMEGATAALLICFHSAKIEVWPFWAGLALLPVIWLSTACVQIPCHQLLSDRFDPLVHQRLVWTNWLRTLAWSVRGVLVLWMAWSLFD